MSHEENHVSKTSGSRVRSFLPHVPQAAGSASPGFGTVTCPSAQYQAGISWPHQSWRDTHQSRMFVIHSSYVFFQSSGVKRVSPRSVAATAFSASGRDLHEPLDRDERLDDRVAALAARRAGGRGSSRRGAGPGASRSRSTFLRASTRSSPA